MIKADAVAFSWAGDKYLGVPYSKMDCQAFVEKCMADCGIHENLPGSNAWYRKVMRNGWVGTPEECIRLFGKIPKGALLFILKQDGKEPGKYQGDGIGNSSHIGIYTGRGAGAINSSSTNECVCESKFNGKSIRGGWNRVGLYDKFDYGKSINWYLEHAGIGENPAEKETEGKPMNVKVTAPESGKTVNLRKKPGGDLIDRIKDGASATVIETTTDSQGTEWSKIKVGKLTGWMMSQFLATDDSQLPAEDPDDFEPADAEPGTDEGGKVALYFTAEELAAILPILESTTEQILQKVGRG